MLWPAPCIVSHGTATGSCHPGDVNMKAFQLTGIRRMELREVPEPVIRDAHDVLLKLEVVGVCGSDVHYYTTGRIGSQVVEYPFTVGHECAATVLDVGKGVARVKPGDLVAVDPAMSCGACDQCLSGRANTCRSLKFLGCPGQIEGCLSERMLMPEACCFKLRPGTSAELGALSEPLAIGVYGVKTSVPMADARIGILGLGPIGLSVLLAARSDGVGIVYGTDPIPERRALAERLGVSLALDPHADDAVAAILEREPPALDCVFECCGEQDAMDQAVALLKPGGKLMLIGIPEVDRISFTIDQLRRKELCLQNVRRQEGCVQDTLDMIETGKVDVSPMVTHRFSFDRTQEAFDLVDAYADGVVKAMITFP